jgi:hypothetical protein
VQPVGLSRPNRLVAHHDHGRTITSRHTHTQAHTALSSSAARRRGGRQQWRIFPVPLAFACADLACKLGSAKLGGGSEFANATDPDGSTGGGRCRSKVFLHQQHTVCELHSWRGGGCLSASVTPCYRLPRVAVARLRVRVGPVLLLLGVNLKRTICGPSILVDGPYRRWQ